jgi:hypothetical protein
LKLYRDNPAEDYLYRNDKRRQTERVAFTLLDYYKFLCIDFSVGDSLCRYGCGERKKQVEREGKGFSFGSSVYAFLDLAFLLFPFFSQNFV